MNAISHDELIASAQAVLHPRLINGYRPGGRGWRRASCCQPNVAPAPAGSVVDCRILPGRQAAFEREVDELIGPDVKREWITALPSYETTFDGDLVDAMNNAIVEQNFDSQFRNSFRTSTSTGPKERR